ncbi:lipocalin family protein [Hymenobacter cellulosivorans]|uniref:Lipocalin family protein n=1 Tax=Hymenobacter cellulosivorans TaxID=2932249 RepID=A0ABY4FCY0_9BACT|nr:lipocalin family protein [Hymenobacter cellulosivorans]UOQ54409.1 lipocalin family protein [Hymenobacter cellulosivorans]
MHRLRLFLLVFVVLGLGAGCKKEKTDLKAALLTGKNWQITAIAITSTGSQTGTVDGYALLQPCEKDNYLRFSSDKTLVLNEGASRCPDTEQQSAGSWDARSDYSTLTIQLNRYSRIAGIQMDIVTLEENQLVLKSTVVQPDQTVVTTTTFSGQ